MTGLRDNTAAVEIAGKGGPEVLVPRNVARPRPSDRQILIKVTAAGVNGPDVQQREGHYPAPKGHFEIPGLEVAGAVAAASATRFKLGDPVMALVNGGGYAEYCVAPETSCLPVPPRLSLVEAGGVPETFFTVWHNVFERGKLKAGEWLLVHGGAGRDRRHRHPARQGIRREGDRNDAALRCESRD